MAESNNRGDQDVNLFGDGDLFFDENFSTNEDLLAESYDRAFGDHLYDNFFDYQDFSASIQDPESQPTDTGFHMQSEPVLQEVSDAYGGSTQSAFSNQDVFQDNGLLSSEFNISPDLMDNRHDLEHIEPIIESQDLLQQPLLEQTLNTDTSCGLHDVDFPESAIVGSINYGAHASTGDASVNVS